MTWAGGVAENAGLLVFTVLAATLVVYLIFAMIHPERF
ncbi:MAG TPA: potassium-transporting ATPase subunit F [Thermoplasmata archaeon]|nr:potassium-transporting ATPase subunit F [Thermoplasmata archaeon]